MDKVAELGLVRDPTRKLYCSECDGSLHFNGGNPAVFHKITCSKYKAGPTFVGPSLIKTQEKTDGE